MGNRGFSLVEGAMGVAVLAILAASILPAASVVNRTKNETAALGVMRSLAVAEATYMSQFGVYGTLSQLGKAGLVGKDLAAGRKAGYRFGELDTDREACFAFCATPMADGKGDEEEFCVTQDGVFQGDFSTRGMAADVGTMWTPGMKGVPVSFTADPGSDPETWSQVD